MPLTTGYPDIFTIPVELAQRILAFCHPWDVAAFSRASRLAYNLVYLPIDQYLWRQLFIALFDHPTEVLNARREAGLPTTSTVIDWRSGLTSRLHAELIASDDFAPQPKRQYALGIFASALQEAAPPTTTHLSSLHASAPPSKTLLWLERIMQASRILENTVSSTDANMLQAHLRAICTASIQDSGNNHTLAYAMQRRSESRSYVYDLRNYGSDNTWGPYLVDGSINWIHVENLVNVILMNLRELPERWASTRPPLGLQATRPHSAPGTYSCKDWAGVEGKWRRYVCFMDYRDLFAFNYSDLADGPRHPQFFEDPRFREATRLMEFKLHIIPMQSSRAYRFATSGEMTSHDPYPPLYFSGSSKGVNGNEAIVEGFVRMGKDGKVHWQFMTIYDSSPQWSSTGIQIGDTGSAMGVVGVWTTVAHDQDDPVGPFWLWKVEEDYPSDLMEYT
ncbi:hypothetical protein BDQ12DRAFT_736537 [Crucibulum laeve]|uniref:F-box domain-containing protein n=1 Tax=Crucibulum laeve TaxID=68775 RepID=A0A5C3LW63_9AGAR|nr:hypothetical protein BDQ12DRAFT_736537 [Crucibulum laeve]